MKQRVKIIGIARHRLSTDGDNVTTPVAFFDLSTGKEASNEKKRNEKILPQPSQNQLY